MVLSVAETCSGRMLRPCVLLLDGPCSAGWSASWMDSDCVFGLVEGSAWRMQMSRVAPLLSSRVMMVRLGTSVRAMITPTMQMKRIGWFL